MADMRAPCNAVRDTRLVAIHHRLMRDGMQLRAAEARMILQWAEACADSRNKADLLDLFAAAGGLKMMRDVCGPMH